MARGVPFCLLVFSLLSLSAPIKAQEDIERQCGKFLLKAAQARAQNYLNKAEEYGKYALRLAKKAQNDSLIQLCLIDLSDLHIYFKKYTKARKERSAALELQSELFGTEHISSLTSTAALIKIDLMQGFVTENAVAQLQEILSAQEKTLGEDHVDVAYNLITQAQFVAAELKNIPQGEALEEPAGAISVDSLKATNAIRHCEKALAILERQHGKRHDELDEALTTIDELISLSSLRDIVSYRLKQQNNKARKINSVGSQLRSFRSEKPVHYGLILGLNWASAYGQATKGTREIGYISVSNHANQLHRLFFGVAGNFAIRPKIYLQPELVIDFKGFRRAGVGYSQDYYYAHEVEVEEEHRFTNLSIPIKVKYCPKPQAMSQLILFAGPSLNIKLAKDISNKMSSSSSRDYDFNLGWMVGTGIHLPDGTNELEFFYHWDLLKTYQDEKLNLKTFSFKFLWFF